VGRLGETVKRNGAGGLREGGGRRGGIKIKIESKIKTEAEPVCSVLIVIVLVIVISGLFQRRRKGRLRLRLRLRAGRLDAHAERFLLILLLILIFGFLGGEGERSRLRTNHIPRLAGETEALPGMKEAMLDGGVFPRLDRRMKIIQTRFAAALLMLGSILQACATEPVLVVSLWPGTAPGDKGPFGEEQDQTKPNENLVAGKRVIRLGNVSRPTISLYQPT
jgi:hypothetical protein